MNLAKKILMSIMIMTGLMLVAAPSASAQLFDNSKEAACKGVQSANCSGGEARIDSALQNIVDLLSVVVGIAAVIMIIIGGFRYITSGGDSNSITSAKHTIIYAIVGLVVVAMAQIIVRFVLTKV